MGFDSDASVAYELDTYAENEGALYNQFKSIIANVARKIKSGKYNAALAPKLWLYWYDEAARRYCKENGCEVKHTFPKKIREACAAERAKDEYEKIKVGEYSIMLGQAGVKL